MRIWLKRTLFVALVFALCWAGAVTYWRNTNTMPGAGDVLMYLLLLPVVVLALVAFARKLLGLALAAPAAQGAAPTASGASAPASASAAQAPAQAAAPLDIAAAAVHLPHGRSAAELRAALAAGEARADLDPELVDDHGFPVLSTRVAGLDVAGLQDAFADWPAQAGQPDPGFADEQWRALALATDVAQELARQAAAHPQLAAHGDQADTARTRAALPTLQLVALLPGDWHPVQRQAANRWLLHVVAAQGWPADHLVLSAAGQRDGAMPLALLDELALQSTRAGLPCLAILLAGESQLGEPTLDRWSAAGDLFTAKHQDGRIPGEGAAGVLLADARQAALLAGLPATRLGAIVHGTRAASADARGRADHTVLTRLGQEALAPLGGAHDRMTLVAGDTDARASRVAEALALSDTVAPHLDPATQFAGTGASCGRAGAVAALAALALAHDDALQQDAPVLCISHQDPFQRSAVLVQPVPVRIHDFATQSDSTISTI